MVALMKLTKNKKRIILFASIGIFVAIVTVVVLLILARKKNNDQPKTSQPEIVSYNHLVTDEEGKAIDAIHDATSESDLTLRFPDLTCNEECKNVSNVKFGNKLLELNKDYNIKEGSVIIILLNELLATMKNGQYNLQFDITSEEKTITAQLLVTIKNSVVEETDEPDKDQPEPEKPTEDSQNPEDLPKEETQNPDPAPNPTPSEEPKPEPEPAPEPEPEPEPEPTPTAEFNLNDGYSVLYFGQQLYLSDEEHNPIMDDNGNYAGVFTFGSCEISKNSVFIKKTYFTSNSHGISEEQQQSEVAAAQAQGYNAGVGTSYPHELDEQFSDICGVSYARW